MASRRRWLFLKSVRGFRRSLRISIVANDDIDPNTNLELPNVSRLITINSDDPTDGTFQFAVTWQMYEGGSTVPSGYATATTAGLDASISGDVPTTGNMLLPDGVAGVVATANTDSPVYVQIQSDGEWPALLRP